MPKQTQKQKLEQKIRRSVFLKEQVKRALISVIPRLNKHDLSTLAALFGHADKRQIALLAKMMAYDDTFLPRMKFFLKAETRDFRANVEKEKRASEKAEDILKKLE
jgi:hypothetical protein